MLIINTKLKAMRMSDKIKCEVLRMLLDKGEMRFSELYNALLQYYMNRGDNINKGSLRVILERILDSLINEGVIKKSVVSHKNVRYSIKNEREARLIVTTSFYWLKNLIVKLLRQNPQNINILIFLPGIFPFLFYVDEEGKDLASYYAKMANVISSYGQVLVTILQDPSIRRRIRQVEPMIFDGDVIEVFRNISEDADPEVVQCLIDAIREQLQIKRG